MLSKEAIDKIEDLTKRGFDARVVDGIPYLPQKMHPIQKDVPDILRVMSLESLVGFVTQASINKDNYLFHVESPTLVSIVSKELDIHNRRECLAVADVTEHMESLFSYGDRYSLEEFIIGVQSAFERDEKRDLLIDSVSNIRVADEESIEDDGFTQKVASKAGAHLSTKVTLPNPIELKPYKSFPEIAPVSEQFIFRVKKDRHGKGLDFKLFASSSMIWELNCVAKIKEYLVASSTLPTI